MLRLCYLAAPRRQGALDHDVGRLLGLQLLQLPDECLEQSPALRPSPTFQLVSDLRTCARFVESSDRPEFPANFACQIDQPREVSLRVFLPQNGENLSSVVLPVIL